jgi:uncharacterized protein YkwD
MGHGGSGKLSTIAIAGTLALSLPAAGQQLPDGPSWYRTKDPAQDARLGLQRSVPLSPIYYAAKDPALGLCAPGADWGTVDRSAGDRFLALLNAHRSRLGTPPLAANPALTAASVWKSMHMAEYDYLDHNDPPPPEARTAFQRGVECGYGSNMAENIAEGQGTPEEAMSDWLESPGHRRNMENPGYTDAGIGVAKARGGDRYWTLDLGSRR